MKKSEITEIFENHGISIDEDEIENLADAMKETLELIADDIEKKEPGAFNSFGRYREVANDLVDAMTTESEEEEEEEEEEENENLN